MSQVTQITVETPSTTVSKPNITPLDRRLLLIRSISLAVLIGIFIHATTNKDFIEFCITYTLWGMILSILLFIFLVIESALSRRYLFHFNETIFGIVWCSEFVITVFFLGGAISLLLAGQPVVKTSISRFLYNLEVHTLPIIILYLDLRRNSYSFRMKKLAYTYIPYGLYILTAVLLSNLRDETAYSVLNWKNWVGVLLSFEIVILNLLGFLLGRKLSNEQKIVPVSSL